MFAGLKARIAKVLTRDNGIELELQEFGYKAWYTVHGAPEVAIFNHDVFLFNVAEGLARPCRSATALESGEGGGRLRPLPTQMRSVGDFRRLLGGDGITVRKE